LAASLFIAISTVSMTLLWATDGRAIGEISLFPGGYASPQSCRECHEEKYQDWSNASHARACKGAQFQAFVQTVPEPGECYVCHATGYDHATGQFALSGVTCEVCHGPYQAEHPDTHMLVVAPQELCGTCHTNTWAEWASSQHGKVGVTCTDCHEVHAQQMYYSADYINAPCVGCHDQPQNVEHNAHLGKANISCVDCHLVRPDDATRAAEKGQVATGHSFVVFVSTCDDCHSTPLVPGTGS